MEQKNNDRIEKMREEMKNKPEMILKEIKSNKSASTVTNPGSEINENRDSQPSGSKTNRSIGVHASNNENSDSENDDYPLRASKMKDLRHPARPIFNNESDVDVTINPEDESDAEEVEDYHSHDVIVEKLTHLVNESLKSGTFPQVLKAARVVPIYKSRKKSIRENYRPISVLSVLSKIFERVVHERLYIYIHG